MNLGGRDSWRGHQEGIPYAVRIGLASEPPRWLALKGVSEKMEQLQCLLVGSVAVEPFVPSPALVFATSLAERNAARLTVCVMPPQEASTSEADPSLHAERAQEIARLNAAETQKHLGNRGTAILATVEPRSDSIAIARLVRLARVNDLTILDSATTDNALRHAATEELLLESGGSVVIVPVGGSSPFPARITIAWDGSASSARAVRDALPFLRAAESVSIVTVTGEKDLSAMTSGQDLANYLLHKNIAEVRTEMLSASGGDVIGRLRRFVTESGTDMLVLGATAHSRVRRTSLGSVIRGMLDQPPATLFLAH